MRKRNIQHAGARPLPPRLGPPLVVLVALCGVLSWAVAILVSTPA